MKSDIATVQMILMKIYECYLNFAFEIREKVLNRRSKIVDRRPVTPQKKWSRAQAAAVWDGSC